MSVEAEAEDSRSEESNVRKPVTLWVCHRHGPLIETMFTTAVRAVRPAALAVRSTLKPTASSPLRAFSTSARILSGGPAPPQLFGTGGKAGEVPTDVEQATGLERLQLLGELEGIKVFDDSPLDSSRIGTKANPILVQSYVGFAISFSLYRGSPRSGCILSVCLSILIPTNLHSKQDVERIVGCTGSPADSHELLWFVLKKEKQGRCTECGSGERNRCANPIALLTVFIVYALDYHGESHDAHAHH